MILVYVFDFVQELMKFFQTWINQVVERTKLLAGMLRSPISNESYGEGLLAKMHSSFN